MDRWPNCLAEITGEYGAACGERRFRPEDLSPVRFAHVCAALFFLAAPLAGFRLEQMIEADQSGSLSTLVADRMARRNLDRAHFTERFDLRVQSIYTIAVGAGVLASALLLQLVSGRPQLPFGAHLVFALHVVSFQYLVTAAIGVRRRLGPSSELAAAIALGLMVIYLAVALKPVYDGSTASIVMKTAVMFALTLAVNYLTSVASIRLALLLV
jgi:hypothetical protein